MELTTEKIIHILPLEDDVRKDLLAGWDTMDPDQKFEIERILWDAYYELYRIKRDKKIELKLAQLGEEGDTTELGPDFYKQVAEETEQELQKESMKSADQSELGTVRTKLEEIMKAHGVVN